MSSSETLKGFNMDIKETIQDVYEKTEEFIGLRSPKIQPFLARRETHRIMMWVTWLITVAVIVMVGFLFRSATDVIESLEAQTVHDTVFVKDTVSVIPDICPRCRTPLSILVDDDPYTCPHCGKTLIRIDRSKEIFVLEKE